MKLSFILVVAALITPACNRDDSVEAAFNSLDHDEGDTECPNLPEDSASNPGREFGCGEDLTTVFGPHRSLPRAHGKPFTEEIDVPELDDGNYMICIFNGDEDGANRISAGWVSVNGTELFNPSDFSKDVASIEGTSALGDDNSISIKLASSPGGYLTTQISGPISPED